MGVRRSLHVRVGGRFGAHQCCYWVVYTAPRPRNGAIDRMPARLTDKERVRIESLVNEKIRNNIQVATHGMDIDTAIKEGAVALFGEKYGDTVRVVDVLGFSKELCGGTHVTATGDIGLFRITSEGSIASGVRRIEAVTGATAYNTIQAEQESLVAIRGLLKAPSNEEIAKLKKLLEKNRQ